MEAEPARVEANLAASRDDRRKSDRKGLPGVWESWRFAWSVAGGVMLAGLAVDAAQGGTGFPALLWPDNAVALGGFLTLQVAVWAALRGRPIFAALGGTRLAVATFALVCGWAVVLGVIPQAGLGAEVVIFERITRAPPFLFLLLLLSANLGWAILKHLSNGLSGASMFLLNHVGITIVLAAGIFGAGDVVRLDVWVGEGQHARTGVAGRQAFGLPFAVYLHRFRIEYFPHQLAAYDSVTGDSLLSPRDDLFTLLPGADGELAGYRVEVVEVSDSAPRSLHGDPVPGVRIRVTPPGGAEGEGWVSSGSALAPPGFLEVGETTFAMAPPRASLYESKVTIVNDDDTHHDLDILVNRPARIGGWWIYQKGYRIAGGPDGRFSQLEMVRDPWLPALYTGLALVALGSMLGFGRAAMLARAAAQADVEEIP